MKNEKETAKANQGGKKMVSGSVEGIGHKVDYAVRENANLGKETIKEWLVKDIKGVYILLAEIINSKEAVDALVEVFWKRYQDMHAAKNAQPELNLKKDA